MTRMRSHAAPIFYSLSDSAASAASTFAVGVSAVRWLPSSGISLFGICMLAFVTSMLLPQQIVFFPSRAAVNVSSGNFRPSLRHDLRQAVYPNIVSAALVLGLTLPLENLVGASLYLALVVPTIFATFACALQAHIRASLHVIGKHGAAAVVSMVSLGTTVATLLASQWLPHSVNSIVDYAAPFSSLALGSIAGLPLWQRFVQSISKLPNAPTFGMDSRLLFIVPDLAVQITWYVMGLIVVGLLGPSQFAALEAARVVAAPVFIFAGGLMSFFLPALIRAMSAPRRRRFERLLLVAIGITVVGAAGYAVVVTTARSMLSVLLQRGYDDLLTAGRSFSNGVEGASNFYTAIFLAAGRPMVAISVILASCVVGGCCAAPLISSLGPIGMVIAQSAVSIGRLVAGTRLLRSGLLKRGYRALRI